MKRSGLFLFLAAAVCCAQPAGPSPAPLSATPTTQIVTEMAPPLHHNIPATDDAGTIWYLCETQDRMYIHSNGQPHIVRDHYIQREPCPTTPIP